MRWFVIVCFAASAWAQQAISTRAGLVQRVEGRAQISDVGPEGLPTNMFVHLEPGQRMRTMRGRAEIVLAPGAYARFSGNSEIELVSADFSDIRVRLIEGSLVADLNEGKPGRDYSVTLLYGELAIELERRGEYEVVAREGAPPELRVHGGKAKIRAGERSVRVSQGSELPLLEDGWGEERGLTVDEAHRFRLIEWSRRRRAELSRGTYEAPSWMDEAPAVGFPPGPPAAPQR